MRILEFDRRRRDVNRARQIYLAVSRNAVLQRRAAFTECFRSRVLIVDSNRRPIRYSIRRMTEFRERQEFDFSLFYQAAGRYAL